MIRPASRVTTIGVDEHVWRHTRLADKYVTVIIDLTLVRAGTGPARLLRSTGFVALSTPVGCSSPTTNAPASMRCLRATNMLRSRSPGGIYQRTVAAYRDPDRHCGKRQLQGVIDALRRGVPAALAELRRLGRTLARHATDILAHFDLPGTSNGPTEALNSRLEHLHGSTPGFRNLRNYIAKSLHETGGFRPAPHPQFR